ncbi:hypothetical protein QTP88_000631 [Uroleucon formosanum]
MTHARTSTSLRVVPTNWLVQNETFNLTNCYVENCYWPAGHVTSLEISEAKNPEQSLCTYEIKLLGRNKTYGDFKKTWHIRVTKESESEEFQLPAKRKETLFDLTNSSSDDSIDNSFPHLQQSTMESPADHQPPIIPDSENTGIQHNMESCILSNYIVPCVLFYTLYLKIKRITIMYQWLKSGSLKRSVNDMNKFQCTDQHSSSDSNHRNVNSKSTVGTKVRKYNTEYLQLGFTFAGTEDESKPQCIICLEILSNESMKTSKLRRHFETKHGEFTSKSLDFFVVKLGEFKKSQKVMKSSTSLSDFCGQYHLYAFDVTRVVPQCFLSAATLTSHILQKSMYPSVEKISLPNSETNVPKRALVEVLFLGIL